MQVLVTGGAGFVGTEVVRQLVDRGDRVVVLDRHEPTVKGADWEPGDIRDAEAWKRASVEADAVCHLAAKVGLGVDLGDMASYVEHNDAGTSVGLRVLYEQRFTGRLVLASSMVVYGEGRYDCAAHGAVRPGPRRAEDLEAGRFDPLCPQCGATLEARQVGEDAPLDPRNVYAATKLHQEHLCEVFGRETGASVAALRYHNVYGRGMPRDTPYAGVAAIFASEVASGRAPQVFEDGRQRRDFVHVRDVARATVMAAVAPPDVVGPLNIATGQPRTVGDLAAALWHAGGSQGPVPQVTGDFRVGDVRHVFASPERASDLLGFRAEIPFEEGLADLFADR